jgi:hypothetical protein
MITSFSATPFQDVKEDPKPFPETGHWVSGDILEFYSSFDDPERIFGSPITETFQDPIRENIQIQYFERVRIEFDPSKPAGKRVTLADLGAWLYDETQRGIPANIPVNNPLCRHFPKNDKDVCFGFLQLYDRYNGAELFGEPVSDVEFVNNRLVQYFERVRMEWRNEMPINQKVVLTEIGRIDFDRRIGNPLLLEPVFIPNVPTVPSVKAFVSHPLLASGNQQVLFVIVRDQFFRPISDAQVEVTVVYSDKSQVNLRVNQPTNSDGVTKTAFTVNDVTPNQVVELKVTALTTTGQEAIGNTWFRIWW